MFFRNRATPSSLARLQTKLDTAVFIQRFPMKIATWNVNSLKVRLPHLLQWLQTNPVDVLCLQETKLTDDKFPVADIEAAGYQVAFTGQKTYNGVAILSKHPLSDVVRNNPHFPDEQQRLIA